MPRTARHPVLIGPNWSSLNSLVDLCFNWICWQCYLAVCRCPVRWWCWWSLGRGGCSECVLQQRRPAGFWTSWQQSSYSETGQQSLNILTHKKEASFDSLVQSSEIRTQNVTGTAQCCPTTLKQNKPQYCNSKTGMSLKILFAHSWTKTKKQNWHSRIFTAHSRTSCLLWSNSETEYLLKIVNCLF